MREHQFQQEREICRRREISQMQEDIWEIKEKLGMNAGKVCTVEMPFN